MSVTCPTALTPSCCQPPKPKSDVIFGTPFQVVGAMAYIDKKRGGHESGQNTLEFRRGRWSLGRQELRIL